MDLYWRNRTFDSGGAPNLPRVTTFDGCRPHRTVSVNYALVTEVQELFSSIIKEAAENGDNVGLDEYNDEKTEKCKSFSEIFICRDCESQKVLGFISVAPSPHSKSIDSLSAQLLILRSLLVANDDAFYRGMLRLAEEFVVTIGMKYTMASINMSLSCTNLLRILRQEGYNITAIIPKCVLMAPGTLYPSAILAKQLLDKDREPRSLVEVEKACEKTTKPKQFEKEYLTKELPSVPFVPFNYTFKCGITVTCRMLKKDEDHIIFDMMQRAMSKGQGYAKHEYPGINEFRKYKLAISPCIVLENNANNEIAGFIFLCDSRFSRTSSFKAGLTTSIINETYRGLGLGKELIDLEIALLVEMKYKLILSCTFMSGRMMFAVVKNGTVTFIGTFPKAGYTPDTKHWSDYLVEYVDLTNHGKYISLSELLYSNKNQSKL